MAPEIRIELILAESKSAVLPLHHSGTFGTQIFKEQYYGTMPKTKNPLTFQVEGSEKQTRFNQFTLRNPHYQSLYIIPVGVSMSNHY
jgi:hypothetical protein